MDTYTSKQITEDFKYLVKNLEETHPNPFLFISKEDLEKDLNELALKAKDVNKTTFFFELMKIFSKMKDSHTRVKGIGRILSETKYPIRFKYLGNRYYISSIDLENKGSVGSKVFSLNKIPMEEVVSKMSQVITHENEIVLSNAIEQWMYEPDLLKYLGIVDDSLIPVSYTHLTLPTIYSV